MGDAVGPLSAFWFDAFSSEEAGHENDCAVPGAGEPQGLFIEDPSRAVIPSAMCLQGIVRVHSVLAVSTHP